MQHRLAGVEPPQPGIVAWIDHPVDRTDAHFQQRLGWLSNLQRFNGSSRCNGQQLRSEADADDRFPLSVPFHQPIKFALKPGQVGSVAIVHPHRPPQHQCDCVWAGAGIGEGIASVWSQDFDRHSPLVGDGANQVSSLAINVLDHQQGGGHSSR